MFKPVNEPRWHWEMFQSYRDYRLSLSGWFWFSKVELGGREVWGDDVRLSEWSCSVVACLGISGRGAYTFDTYNEDDLLSALLGGLWVPGMGADSLKICDDDDCILAWLVQRPRIIGLSSAADLGGIHTSGFLVAELPGVPEVDDRLWAVGIGMGEG